MRAALLGLPYRLWAGSCVVVALLGGITYACFLGTVVVATSKPTRRR